MSRKLDAALATELGYEVQVKHRGCDAVYLTPGKVWSEECPACSYDGLWVPEEVPWFHSDANAMLWLDREMRERGWFITNLCYFSVDKLWECKYEHYKTEGLKRVVHFADGEAEEYAPTMPEAVALAAYHALSGEEWTP